MAPRIAVLGTTEVDVATDAASLTRRDRVVLGALTASHGEPLTVDQLGDALWGDEPPKSSAKVVQGSVMRLRRLLGTDAIETTGAGYRLALDGDTVDSHVFERLVARGRELASEHDPERAAAAYEQALALWRGAPLPELQDWDPGRAEAERLLEVRRSVEEELVEARMECGLVAAAVADAQHLVRREPYREHRWALLALALYRTGRQREALDALRRARTTLVDELGLDPGPELVDLEQRILQQDPTLLDIPEAPIAASTTCPWPGLRPFESERAELYAGRDADVDACLARLAAYPLLVVVGASGSGKSSLVRAGLAPRLRTEGAAVLVIAPGATPVATLTTALSSLPDDGVLVVDQLEELFAPTRSDDVVGFLDRLAERVASGSSVVVTLRADYLASIAGSSAFAREAERGLLLLAPMDEAQLRDAIEQPARRSGLRLEPGLVDVLLRDVGNDAGGLPLLSHALAETWSRRDGSVLTVEGYRATGGINGAVAQSAERLYESLSADDRDGLRAVLQRLVTPTPAGDPVAARVPTRVFDGTDDAPRLLDLLVRARLVTASADTATLAHESLVRAWPRLSTWLDEDVEGQRVFAHLQVAADGWEAGGRPDDELYRGARLETALEWRERAHPVLAQGEIAFLDASAGYAESEDRRRAAELASQRTRNRQLRGALAGVVALLVLALVAGSLAVVRGRQAQESAAQARDAADAADAARLGATSRTEKDLGLALLTAVQAATDSPTPLRQADVLAALSRSSVVSSARSTVQANARTGDGFSPDGKYLVASAWNGGVTIVDAATGQTVGGAPIVPHGSDPEHRYDHLSIAAGFVDQGRVVAVASDPSRVTFTPDDAWRAKRVITYWSLGSGARVGSIEEVPDTATGDFFRQDLLHISADGRVLVSYLDRAARVWRKQSGRWVGPTTIALPAFPPALEGQDFLHAVSFSADDRLAALTVEYQGPPTWATLASVLLDLRTGIAVSGWNVASRAAAVAPDGRHWAYETYPTGLAIAPTAPGPVTRVATPLGAGSVLLSWSADSRRLAQAAEDGSTRVYDASGTRLVAAFPADGARPAAIRMLESGARVVTAREDGRIDVRSLRGDTPVLRMAATSPVSAVAAGASGTVVAGGLDDGRVAVVDQRSMRVLRTLSLAPYPTDGRPDESRHMRVTAVAVTPDGTAVIAGNRSGVMRMWSAADGKLLATVTRGPFEQMAASPDGRFLATVESVVDPRSPGALAPDWVDLRSTTVRLWSLPDLVEVAHADISFLDGRFRYAPKAKMIHFSPDSSMLVVPYLDDRLSVFQTDGLRPVSTIETEDGPGFISAVFSPDSTLLLGRRTDGREIRRLDPGTGKQVGPPFPGTPGNIYGDMGFGPGGTWLFSRAPDGLSAYDARTGQQLLDRVSLVPGGLDVLFDGGEGAMTIVGDGHLFASTAAGIARLDIDPARWHTEACRIAGRTLTREEWDRLLPAKPYAPACTEVQG